MNAESVLQRFFEEPGGHVVLDPNLCIVDVGPEFIRLTHSSRDAIIGKYFIDTFTDPDPKRQLELAAIFRASIQNAIKQRKADKMEIFRCDVRRADGRLEERWWQSANIPIYNEFKTLEYIVHRSEDVTILMRTHNAINAQRRSNYILYGMVVLLFGLSLYAFEIGKHNVEQQSKKSCEIQSIFLPGQHALASVMESIDNLITLPPQKGRPQTPQNKKDLVDIHRNLKVYLNTVNHTPTQRVC